MNTTLNTTRQVAQRLVSLALSTVFTVALLAGTNHLATSEPSPQLVAHVMQAGTNS